jgi:hypothetical protein
MKFQYLTQLALLCSFAVTADDHEKQIGDVTAVQKPGNRESRRENAPKRDGKVANDSRASL